MMAQGFFIPVRRAGYYLTVARQGKKAGTRAIRSFGMKKGAKLFGILFLAATLSFSVIGCSLVSSCDCTTDGVSSCFDSSWCAYARGESNNCNC